MISGKNIRNWLLDFIMFLFGLLAVASGLPFLFEGLKVGHGRESGFLLGVYIINKESLKDFHTWTGLIMLVAVIIHLILHWKWIKRMSINTFMRVSGIQTNIGKGARKNLLVNAFFALTYLAVTISSVYFLFGPSGGYMGGRNPDWNKIIVFPRTTWSSIHETAGIGMVVVLGFHIYIHWRWIKNVASRMIKPKQRAARRMDNFRERSTKSI